MRVGSLFSGIGGLDLGLERAGMTVIWQSEIDPYASKVLAKQWPHVPNLGDIKTVDWSTVERPDLVCGGYPCQPFSFAGQRAGTDDPRHLWPWMRDAVRLLGSRWVLLENVPGHLGLGFDAVLADLATLGFDAEWELLPASAFGAPHLRYRLFVVAHANRQSEPGQPVDAFPRPRVMVPDASGDQLRDEPVAVAGGGGAPVARDDGPRWDVAHADRSRQSVFQGCATFTERLGVRTADGAGWWSVEPDVGRVADGVPARVDRLRCLGNAVVPQVAEWIGRRLMAEVGAFRASEEKQG